MKLPLCAALAALFFANLSSAQITVDRFVDASEMSFTSLNPNGDVQLNYRARVASQNAGPENLSMEVCVFQNGQLMAVITEAVTNVTSGGQTCGGSCNPGDCSLFGSDSSCHDFSGIPGSAGCQCSIVVDGSVVLALTPGDQIAVEVIASPGAVPEFHFLNNIVSFTFEEIFPSSCNGDGGNQAGCTDCPCMNNAPPGSIGGCTHSAGMSSRLWATGDTSVSLPAGSTTDLRLRATNLPPGSFGVLISGNAVAPGNMANPCFGLDTGIQFAEFDGLRCSVQQTQRHGGRAANAFGDIEDSAGPSRVWGGEAQPSAGIAGQAGFAAGQTRYFQINHREDAMAGCMRGINTSQAVRAMFRP